MSHLVVAALCCSNWIVKDDVVVLVLWVNGRNLVALRSCRSRLLAIFFSPASSLLGNVHLVAVQVTAALVGAAEHAATDAHHGRPLARVHHDLGMNTQGRVPLTSDHIALTLSVDSTSMRYGTSISI